MKQLGLLLIAGLLTFGVSAQITLDHTFSDYIYSANTHLKTVYYTVNGSSATQISFYNEDYSFYKAVTVTLPANCKIQMVSNVSDHLFNSDNLLEFICTFFDTVNYTGYVMKLYNENGTEILDLGNSYYAVPHKTLNNEVRLLVTRYTNYSAQAQETDVYLLTGSIAPVKNVISGDMNLNPYPNPAGNFVTLPYKIGESETTDLNIFDTGGRLIESKRIGGVFDKIVLDVSAYAPGQYYYVYNGSKQQFIVK